MLSSQCLFHEAACQFKFAWLSSDWSWESSGMLSASLLFWDACFAARSSSVEQMSLYTEPCARVQITAQVEEQ